MQTRHEVQAVALSSRRNLKDRKLVHYRGDYTAFKKMHLQKRATLDKEYKKQQERGKCFAETIFRRVFHLE